MDLSAPVDIYCERVDPAFWAEPLNAVSNAAFLLAALWAARSAAKAGLRQIDLWVLIALAAAIGIGSFLFHTFATVWAGLADVIPIWIFVLIFTITGALRVGGLSYRAVLAGGLIVAGCIAILSSLSGGAEAETPAGPDPLNGSGQYAPAIIALIIFSVVSKWRGHMMHPWILGATITFAISLTFRTIDMHLCDAVPIGTHFMWHVLNGLMIGLLLQGLIRTLAAGSAGKGASGLPTGGASR